MHLASLVQHNVVGTHPYCDLDQKCYFQVVFHAMGMTQFKHLPGGGYDQFRAIGYDQFRAVQLSSVQFSCSVMSDSLRHHESKHARPPCPSPPPGVPSNSCPSSQ